MDSKKEFYRKAYYDVCDKMNKKAIVSLTGPRQVGKTFAMKQLQKNFGGEYYNFKTMQTDKSDNTVFNICGLIRRKLQFAINNALGICAKHHYLCQLCTKLEYDSNDRHCIIHQGDCHNHFGAFLNYTEQI